MACEHASCAVQVLFFVSGGHFPVYFNAFGILFKKGQFCEVKKKSETRITVDILKQEPKIKR